MRTTLSSLATVAALAFVLHPVHSAAQVSLDYEYYKARVEPLFLTKRDGHARCFVCHVRCQQRVQAPEAVRARARPGPTRNRARTSPWLLLS